MSQSNPVQAAVGYRQIADANFFADRTCYLVTYTALTAPRTVTIGPANSFDPLQSLVIADINGLASSTNPITVAFSSGTTVNGLTNSIQINKPFGTVALTGTGTNNFLFNSALLAALLPASSVTTFNSASATPTYPAANLTGSGDVGLILTGATVAVTGTLDTTANIIAAAGSTGTDYRLRFVNQNTATVTVTPGDGNTTISGTATVPAATWREYDVKVTSATTILLTSVGAGTV